MSQGEIQGEQTDRRRTNEQTCKEAHVGMCNTTMERERLVSLWCVTKIEKRERQNHKYLQTERQTDRKADRQAVRTVRVEYSPEL